VPGRDRPERVPQPQIPAEMRGLKVRRAPPPIVLRQRREAVGRETLGQQARLHRAVHDDTRLVPRTPRELAPGGGAVDHRKRRLERVDVTDGLASVEESRVEVRDADRADFSFFHEPWLCESD